MLPDTTIVGFGCPFRVCQDTDSKLRRFPLGRPAQKCAPGVSNYHQTIKHDPCFGVGEIPVLLAALGSRYPSGHPTKGKPARRTSQVETMCPTWLTLERQQQFQMNFQQNHNKHKRNMFPNSNAQAPRHGRIGDPFSRSNLVKDLVLFSRSLQKKTAKPPKQKRTQGPRQRAGGPGLGSLNSWALEAVAPHLAPVSNTAAMRTWALDQLLSPFLKVAPCQRSQISALATAG